MNQLNQTPNQLLPSNDIQNKAIEKYIHQNHTQFRNQMLQNAKRCIAVDSPRAESEYQLCIARINEWYNKLLSTIDFKLQVAYKIVVTKEDIQERRQKAYIQNHQGRGNSTTTPPHRKTTLRTFAIFGSLSFLAWLFSTMPFSVLHIVGTALSGAFIIPVITQIGKRRMDYNYRDPILRAQIQENQAYEQKCRKRKQQKLISYAVSLERLVTNLYQESIRTFQQEYVFTHPNQAIPKSFATAPPQLQYIYQPLLHNWAH